MNSHWGETGKGGRRKYFSITEQGKKELKEKLDDWNVINKLIQECIKEDNND
ncbi:PadR family transcriptional regulator [Clostridium sp. DMHC 10]|uniref:PadR family transcriptional regulator n=1 Tax=Clostridium sp. DMHC 10 TaxID=747377 RepID=UPI00325A5702